MYNLNQEIYNRTKAENTQGDSKFEVFNQTGVLSGHFFVI